MYKIIFSEEFEKSLNTFIQSYEDSFISLYTDSGIVDRYLIVENYRNLARSFYYTIREMIHSKLSENVVLGRRESEKGTSLIFHERSFLIIIDYTEDEENKIRYIENIIFTKK